MPLIAKFYGISILIFYQEHNPPHFHAKYGGEIGIFDIQTGKLIIGQLPLHAKKLIREWFKLHQKELLVNWLKAKNGEQLQFITPLL